jgi:hypothetical protein
MTSIISLHNMDRRKAQQCIACRSFAALAGFLLLFRFYISQQAVEHWQQRLALHSSHYTSNLLMLNMCQIVCLFEASVAVCSTHLALFSSLPPYSSSRVLGLSFQNCTCAKEHARRSMTAGQQQQSAGCVP